MNVVNVASVPQRSPFRYPGGKTWLIPVIRKWLRAFAYPVKELIEPFAGGGVVSLTAVFENLAETATMVELDEDIASVWRTILNGQGAWLGNQISNFAMTHENVADRLANYPGCSLREHAFITILRNRINRGGILAPGAGVVKTGENGKGLLSRWYPDTLRKRILSIVQMKNRFRFIQGDGIPVIRDNLRSQNIVFFVDPPYTVAGRRLYKYSNIDHRSLFALTARSAGDFLMTYDDAPEIRTMADEFGFQVATVPMKNTHHARKVELLVGRDLSWLKPTD